jgi:endonuclease/exonuclease/phosphatase family metal-dependent hydrolase
MSARFALFLTVILLTLCTALHSQHAVPTFLNKPSDDAIRVLTWNVYRNSIIPRSRETIDPGAATRPSQFARVLRAVHPDIVCLQDVTATVRQTGALLDQIVPLGGGRKWQVHTFLNVVIATRYALGGRGGGRVEDGTRRRGHAIAMIRTPTTDLYMICAHFQSSDGPADVKMRQRQAEMLARTIRDAREGHANVTLAPRTPIVLLGDFNAIPGGEAFVNGLAVGDLTAKSGGTSDGLDWDRSSLTDALPHHNVSGTDLYTWRNDLDRYPPGILDRILYSDSVLSSVNQFVLDTTALSYVDLTASGMRTIDVMRDPVAGIHDHFPLVIDFVLRKDGPAR